MELTNNTKRIYALLVAIIAMACLQANAATIKGKITNNDGKPVAFATVWIESQNITTVSGLDGTYTLRDVPTGTHQLCAIYFGYRKEVMSINVGTNGEISHNFTMDEPLTVMPEVFVTPTGESIEEFIVRMVAEHKKPLNAAVSSFDGLGSLYWETDNDSLFHYMQPDLFKMLKVSVSILGFGTLLTIERDYPGAKFTIDQKLSFNGTVKGDRQVVGMMAPTFKQKEVDYLEKHSWKIDHNVYDLLYKQFNASKINRTIASNNKAQEKARNKGIDFKRDTNGWKYIGLYEEDGRDVYIIKKGKKEFHIVDGVWQIKRCTQEEDETKTIAECREMLPGIYLPVSYYMKDNLNIDKKGNIRKVLEDEKKTNRSNMSQKEQEKLDKRIASLEKEATHTTWNMVRCYTWDYKNLVPSKAKAN